MALVTPQELWILGITTLLFVLLYVYFEWTKWGLAMRAVAINQTSSALMGISVLSDLFDYLGYQLGAGCGGAFCSRPYWP